MKNVIEIDHLSTYFIPKQGQLRQSMILACVFVKGKPYASSANQAAAKV